MFYKPMLAKEYEKERGKVKFPCYVQPKLDGVRLIWDGYQAWSRNAKPLQVPISVRKDLNQIYMGKPLDGELYAHGVGFDAISGQVRRVVNPDDEIDLMYIVFDAPSPGRSFAQRLKELSAMCYTPNVQLLETVLAKSHDEIEKWMVRWLEAGYEGIIIRDREALYMHKRTHFLLKYKHFIEEQAKIVGFVEGKGKHVGRLGALVVEEVTEEEGPVWSCNVGTGFNDQERQLIWDDEGRYEGKRIILKYQEKTAKGNPRFPVFVRFA